MFSFLKLYLLTIPAFVLLDYLWLGKIAEKWYQAELGDLARRAGESFDPVKWSALIVYLLIPLGILLFVVPRAGKSVPEAMIWGALFGFVLYGVYDFTNYALIKNWPLHMSLVDTMWGGVICALVSAWAVFVAQRMS